MTTVAPSLARPTAAAFPIPELLPVTRHTLPFIVDIDHLPPRFPLIDVDWVGSASSRSNSQYPKPDPATNRNGAMAGVVETGFNTGGDPFFFQAEDGIRYRSRHSC